MLQLVCSACIAKILASQKCVFQTSILAEHLRVASILSETFFHAQILVTFHLQNNELHCLHHVGTLFTWHCAARWCSG